MRWRLPVTAIILACVATLVLYTAARHGTYKPQSYRGSGSVVRDDNEPTRYSISLPAIHLSKGDALEPHFKIVNGPPIDRFVVAFEAAAKDAEKIASADFNVEVLIHPLGATYSQDSDLARLVYASNGPLSAWRVVAWGNGHARRYLPPATAKTGSLRAGADYEISININPLGSSKGPAGGADFELTPLVMPAE